MIVWLAVINASLQHQRSRLMYRPSYYELSIKTRTEQLPAQGVDVVATAGELLTWAGKFLAVPSNGREQETKWSRDCAVKYMYQPGSRINVAIRACVSSFSYSDCSQGKVTSRGLFNYG